MFAVTGKGTTIVQELEKLTGEEAVRIGKTKTWPGPLLNPFEIPSADRFVLAAGILLGKSIEKVSQNEALECCGVNLITVIRLCEAILGANPFARICVVSSYSTQTGSFDRLYAATKAGVDQYVMTRRTLETQQLCGVSPTIIIDSGMTRRRPDFPDLEERRPTIRAIDVARVIFEQLWSTSIRNRNRVLPITQRRNP